jgi:hypothetical protein
VAVSYIIIAGRGFAVLPSGLDRRLQLSCCCVPGFSEVLAKPGRVPNRDQVSRGARSLQLYVAKALYVELVGLNVR